MIFQGIFYDYFYIYGKFRNVFFTNVNNIIVNIRSRGKMKRIIAFVIIILYLLPTIQNKEIIESTDIFSNQKTNIIEEAIGEKGIWAQNITGLSSITIDNDLSEWENIPYLNINNVLIWLAFDESNVYIAFEWDDITFDDELSHWRKYGMFNETIAYWFLYEGADDALSIGFTQNGSTDISIWTASNRTDNYFMYECDENGFPDLGNLPYVMNTNKTLTFENAKPIYDNSSITLPSDESIIQDGTSYVAWFDSNLSPNESQNDTEIAIDWNNNKIGTYSVEIVRALNTGHGDDIVINFSEPLIFSFGISNKHFARSMLVTMEDYLVSLENEVSNLTLNPINDANPIEDGIQVYDDLYLQGTVYDDYKNSLIYIQLPAWEYTYGPNFTAQANIHENDGTWSYYLHFNEFDMPLGENEIIITLVPQYDNPITINETIIIDDIIAPTIYGIVDIAVRFPDGVPYDQGSVLITAGLSDNYCINDDITAFLYYYKDNDVATIVGMSQFLPGSTSFIADIPIEPEFNRIAQYTYFLQVWDTNLNIKTSEHFTFFVQPTTSPSTTPPETPSTTSKVYTLLVPLRSFGLILGVLLFLSMKLFLLRKKNQRNK